MPLDPSRFYLPFAAAFVRGSLGIDGSDAEVVRRGEQARLRLHRYKISAELPRVRRVIGMLHSLRPHDLLDIGTGRGVFLWPLLHAFPDLRVTCVDTDPNRIKMLNTTASGGIPRLQARLADAAALPFPAGSFDGCTALEVLEHLPNPALAAHSLVRVANRFVVVSVPSKDDTNPEHIQRFHESSLTTLFMNAGAKAVRCERVRGHIVAMISTHESPLP